MTCAVLGAAAGLCADAIDLAQRTDDGSGILDALTDEPGEGRALMTKARAGHWPRIADYLRTLGPNTATQQDC